MRTITTTAEWNAFSNHTTSPIIIDIYADWCGPCKRIAPTFEEASNNSNFKFFKYDADLQLDIEDLKVSSLPTFLVFYNRGIINTLVGGNKDRFLEFIKDL